MKKWRKRQLAPRQLLIISVICRGLNYLLWSRNSYIDRIVYHFLTDWFFLTKHAFNFTTKLHFRYIKKCHWLCVWIPMICSPLFEKQYVPCQRRPAFRLTNTWSSLWAVICHKNVQQSKVCPPPPQSKIAGSVPVKGTAESMVAQKPLRIWRIGDWVFCFFSWLWVLTRDREIESAINLISLVFPC